MSFTLTASSSVPAPVTPAGLSLPERASADEVLWKSLPGRLPTLRQECRGHFAKAFGIHKIHDENVWRDGRLIAALPLVVRHWKGLVKTGSLPVNDWLGCGDLLGDPARADDRAFDELASAVLKHGCSLLDFQWAGETSDWNRFLQAFGRRGCRIDRQPQFDVGIIELAGTWDEYFAGRSRLHRKNMRAAMRNLEKLGRVAFERHSAISGDHVLDALLTEAFAIEHLGWKREAGTSLRSAPGMESLFRQVAAGLNRHSLLEIQFLRLDGRAIAFELGYRSGTTYFSHKVGYDPEFSRYSPGQLLMYCQLQEWFATREIRCIDTMGILSEATAKWCNSATTLYRYRVFAPGPAGAAGFFALRTGRRIRNWLRTG